MGVATKIAWADHSFSPWIGCSPVHAGCDNCYAAAMSGRLGVTWGPNGSRRRTARSTWLQVERWNRQARCRCGEPPLDVGEHCQPCLDGAARVFLSLCDPFEDWQGPILDSTGEPICELLLRGTGTHDTDPIDMDDVRRDFFGLIDRCPNLDFLLATKRPQNVLRMWPCSEAVGKRCPACGSNEGVHGGCRCGLLKALWGKEQTHRRNVWLLYSASDQETLDAGLPHLLACRDLVPMLGLSLEPLLGPVDLAGIAVDWVIVGGESGPRARPCNVEWIRSIAFEQCRAVGVPCFVKQDSGRKPGQQGRIPDDLWSVKEFPNAAR